MIAVLLLLLLPLELRAELVSEKAAKAEDVVLSMPVVESEDIEPVPEPSPAPVVAAETSPEAASPVASNPVATSPETASAVVASTEASAPESAELAAEVSTPEVAAAPVPVIPAALPPPPALGPTAEEGYGSIELKNGQGLLEVGRDTASASNP